MNDELRNESGGPPVRDPKIKLTRPQRVPPSAPPWNSPAGLWRRKSTIISALALIAIASHLAMRFVFHLEPIVSRMPLLVALVVGGLPLLAALLRKLFKREFGSDLLGGISVVTSIVLGEYLAGTIIVLMLAGGEALESYALASASSVLAALARRMPSIAHRKSAETIVNIPIADIMVGDTLVIAAAGHLSPVIGAIIQEAFDVLAVLNALRAAFPPRVIHDL